MQFYSDNVIVKKYAVTLVKGRKEITEISSVKTFADIQVSTPKQEYLKDGLTSKNKFFDIFFDGFYDFADGRDGESSVVIKDDLKFKIIGKQTDLVNNYSYAVAVLTND
jgi:hypothetical protein